MAKVNRRSFMSIASSVPLLLPGTLQGFSGSHTGRGVFRDIPNQFISPGVNSIRTYGYHSFGDRGHATYLHDHLATADLANVAPLFCTSDAYGRYWRAGLTTNGLVPVAAGGAVGSASQLSLSSVNDQPAIAQAMAYQEQIGAEGLEFNDGHFSIWCPWRSAADDNVDLDKSGIPFLIHVPTILQSGPNCTTFHRRKFDGSDPSVFTGTQYLPQNFSKNGSGVFWRGGMFLLVGQPDPRPSYDKLTALTLQGTWNISGGLLQSAVSGSGLFEAGTPPWYVLNPDGSGSGWDVTDKPIWAANALHTGDITFDGNITLGGFRGELLYQQGGTHGSIYQTGTLTLHDTDGDALCPGPSFSNSINGYGTLQMQSVNISNVYQALEGCTGWDGYITELQITNCMRGGGLYAGIWARQTYTDHPAPFLNIGSVCLVNSGSYCFCQGNIVASVNSIDTTIWISTPNFGTSDVQIQSISVTADNLTIDGIIFFGGSTKGSCLTQNNVINSAVMARTPKAAAAGNCVFNAVNWYASLGGGNVIKNLSGLSRVPPGSENPASVTDQSPQIISNTLTYLGQNP